ncbi:MAG: hypothetical protein ACK40Z_12900 [Dietzia sp.]
MTVLAGLRGTRLCGTVLCGTVLCRTVLCRTWTRRAVFSGARLPAGIVGTVRVLPDGPLSVSTRSGART